MGKKLPPITAKQRELAAYHAELAHAFGKRRCSCGAPALVIVVYDAALEHTDRNLCMRCAGMAVEGGDRSTA